MKVIPFFIIFVETIDIMKNIHILLTDQPSRLYIVNSISELSFSNGLLPQVKGTKNQHIYITSDEDIKENDWGLSKLNEIILFGRSYNEKFYKKIILTTDQLLIADGVQSIDNEFLKWFVKNPTCEYVEVKSYWKLLGNDYEHNGYATLFYEYVKEEPKQELPTYDESIQQILTAHKIPKELFGQEEPKQETLEEAAECKSHHSEEDFIRGAKWQEERMYSEDEVDELVNNLIDKFLNYNGSSVDNEKLKWFYQQIKKK